ncbi:MAG: c-type cytochrome [Acidobacteriota bacterium]
MKAALLLTMWGCVVLWAQPTDEREKIVQSSDCSSCHAVDRQVVGPAYSTIAQRYAGQSDAVDKLAARILEGGGGMPAHPALTNSQRQAMAEWVLLQKSSSVAQGPAKQYPQTLKDGTTVTLDFPLFAEDKPGKVTRDVFHGYQFYNSYCYRCHGTDATGGQLAPDLRRSVSTGSMDLKAFLAVAMPGKPEKGMPAWAGFLTEDDVIHIYKYVKGRSLDLIAPGRPPSQQDP